MKLILRVFIRLFHTTTTTRENPDNECCLLSIVRNKSFSEAYTSFNPNTIATLIDRRNNSLVIYFYYILFFSLVAMISRVNVNGVKDIISVSIALLISYW